VNTGAGEPVKLDMLTRQAAQEAAEQLRSILASSPA